MLPQTATIKYLEGLGLTLLKGVALEDYFIPGKLEKLLIDPEVAVPSKKPLLGKA